MVYPIALRGIGIICRITMTVNTIRYRILCRALYVAILMAAIPECLASTEAKPRIALLGDSMTWIGGDSCQNPTGWTHRLRESGVASRLEVYARSGATWTNTSRTKIDTEAYSEVLDDDNVIYNQAIRLVRDHTSPGSETPDMIIIFAGANDAWFSDRRPGIFDDVAHSANAGRLPSEATTLKSSVALVCDILLNSFPRSTLIMITPIEMSKVSADATERVGDIIESSAAGRGVTTLRADREVEIRHAEESESPRFTYDGVHTNEAGAALLADFIIREISSVIERSR